MASTTSASTLSAGPSVGGNGSGGAGGMDELLPLVLQLTNAESVSIHCLQSAFSLRNNLGMGMLRNKETNNQANRFLYVSMSIQYGFVQPILSLFLSMTHKLISTVYIIWNLNF